MLLHFHGQLFVGFSAQFVQLSQKVAMYVDEELEGISKATHDLAGVKMTIQMKDVKEYRTQVRFSKGTLNNPSSPAELHQKFTKLAGKVCSSQRVETITQFIGKLEGVKDISFLDQMLTYTNSEFG